MLSAGMITKILPKYILEKYETDREDRLEAIKDFTDSQFILKNFGQVDKMYFLIRQ